MSRAIPGRPRSAAPSCNRIDLAPSRRAAVLAAVWLALVCFMVLAAVDLPLPGRIVACAVLVVPGLAAIRCTLLLRGHRAVRSLQWTDGAWSACLGTAGIDTQVSLAPGSFRIGTVLVLWLRACDRTYCVCIDAGAQDQRGFRRLCRRLRRAKPAS